MQLESIASHLEAAFDPGPAAHLDAVIRLQTGGRDLTFRVANGRLDFAVPAGVPADATFMFRDVDTAWALLSGRANAFDAFMDGSFRSDGHLMWAFLLMAMFRSSSLPARPIE